MKLVLEFFNSLSELIGFSTKKDKNQLLPIYIKTQNRVKKYNR